MSIFHVVSNLNHNGTIHKKGSFFEGEVSEFESVISIGVLKVVEGAKDLEHAAKIIAEEATKQEVASAEVKEPQNTWGPKPDPIVAPVEAPKTDATDTKTTEAGTPAPEAPKTSNEVAPLDLNAGLNL